MTIRGRQYVVTYRQSQCSLHWILQITQKTVVKLGLQCATLVNTQNLQFVADD